MTESPEFGSPEAIELAQKARQEKKEADIKYARANLRDDFGDKAHWRGLASMAGIKMPSWYKRTTRRDTIKFFNRIKKNGYTEFTFSEYLKDFWGEGVNASNFNDLNPDYPLYATVGLILEDLVDTHGELEL